MINKLEYDFADDFFLFDLNWLIFEFTSAIDSHYWAFSGYLSINVKMAVITCQSISYRD